MRKFTLIIMMVFTFSGLTIAQTIEDFESLKMNLFSGGANGSITVVPNPDPTGINTSAYVSKMVRGFDGDPWAGWYATLPTPIDVTANRYVHVKVWKPRISPVVFKYEKDGANSGDVFPLQEQTLVNQWEELVFDMSIVSGEYVKIVLIPDFLTPVGLTEDITLYYDDLYVNNDPAVGSPAVQVMEDYETIPLNYMGGGAEDLSFFTLLANPDKSGINISDYVLKFHRDKDGVPWGGFWSALPVPTDVTDNKYVHVKVWKPRISPIRFKLEGGAAGTLELPSSNAQTETGVWEDFVFDYSEKTGTYPVIAFMPDFEDPLTLAEDIVIYIDDIRVNNDPNPMTPPEQIFNVDMSEAGLAEGQQVYIAGSFGGIHGTWSEPGTNPNNEMFDTDGDLTYTISMAIPDGVIEFRFFKGAGWDGGDPVSGGNRMYDVSGSFNLTYKWGVEGIVAAPSIQFNLNMAYQISIGAFDAETDYVDVAGSFNEWNGDNHHLTAMGDGMYSITIENLVEGETVEFKFRKNGSWDTSEFPGGGPNRTHLVAAGVNELNLWYNNEALGIDEDNLNGKIKMYPNPVNNELTVKITDEAVNRIIITSMLGQVIEEIELTSETTTINTSSLNNGMYFVTFITKDGNQLIQKFMKK
ncbi:MAG: hypothetical protein CVT92_01670 [Bacteroidetes bacterium HGW-Bacteroidetes-1]|nr:MAG: hypothetical protein CVT92_01670 [Bacteroidetes bacterium HGW-Bacteroidetes-1]